MNWYNGNEEDEDEADLMFSPALLARRASESWIDSLPIEVDIILLPIEMLYSHVVALFCHVTTSNSELI